MIQRANRATYISPPSTAPLSPWQLRCAPLTAGLEFMLMTCFSGVSNKWQMSSLRNYLPNRCWCGVWVKYFTDLKECMRTVMECSCSFLPKEIFNGFPGSWAWEGMHLKCIHLLALCSSSLLRRRLTVLNRKVNEDPRILPVE